MKTVKKTGRNYRWRKDNQKHSDDDSRHTEQETDQPHASSLTPREPYASNQSRYDLYHQDDDGLCGPTLLSTPNGHAKCQVRSKKKAGEHL